MNEYFTSQRLGTYYISRRKVIRFSESETKKFDEDGVPLKKIPYSYTWEYYPCRIAQYALGYFEEFLEAGNPQYKENFLVQADWLVDNVSDKNGFGVWEHHYTLPFYEFDRVPWIHGMAQGLAVSALLRAFQITGDDRYLHTAEKAYGAFEVDIEDGGARYVDEKGDIWLEEYAILPPPHVLNGFIFALFGVYDLYRVTKSDDVLDMWRAGIETIQRNLPRYDMGYWSRYNLLQGIPATLSYHDLHVQQLKALYQLIGEDIFERYAKKWGYCRGRISHRIRAKIARGFVHIQRYGIGDCVKRACERRRWANE